MSYVWLFPPLCDPFDGHLLGIYTNKTLIIDAFHYIYMKYKIVDGCYVNNVPGKKKLNLNFFSILLSNFISFLLTLFLML